MTRPALEIPSCYIALALGGRRQNWLALWWSRVATWRQR